MNSFQLVGIPPHQFSPLFALSESQLAQRNARRVIATTNPGYPCRVSLVDAQVGEELLLLPYQHQPGSSPYQASGPIFVRRLAEQAALEAGVIPDYVQTRLISIRAYDVNHLMIDAEVCAGSAIELTIQKMFKNDAAAYIHLHYANRGCFACTVIRA
jgi:Protein of unknown function (DUF1203)